MNVVYFQEGGFLIDEGRLDFGFASIIREGYFLLEKPNPSQIKSHPPNRLS
jgi:hypothetical protein